jgi:hypothetical protein
MVLYLVITYPTLLFKLEIKIFEVFFLMVEKNSFAFVVPLVFYLILDQFFLPANLMISISSILFSNVNHPLLED